MQGTMVSSPPPVQRQQNLQVRNSNARWSKQDDDKLIKILQENMEPDVILRPAHLDKNIQNMFGRSPNAIKCRIMCLIYNNYDEDKWDNLRINNGITKHAFDIFCKKIKFNEENKQDKKDAKDKIIDELKKEINELKNEIKELKHENNLMKCHKIYCGAFPEEVGLTEKEVWGDYD